MADALTALDRMVYGYLDWRRGVRLTQIHAVVTKHRGRYGTVTFEDVRQIVRGLEHLGLAVNHNGWWRRGAGNALGHRLAPRDAA